MRVAVLEAREKERSAEIAALQAQVKKMEEVGAHVGLFCKEFWVGCFFLPLGSPMLLAVCLHLLLHVSCLFILFLVLSVSLFLVSNHSDKTFHFFLILFYSLSCL